MLKIESGPSVVGRASTAGPAGEVESLRGGVGRHGLLLLAILVLKRSSLFLKSFWRIN